MIGCSCAAQAARLSHAPPPQPLQRFVRVRSNAFAPNPIANAPCLYRGNGRRARPVSESRYQQTLTAASLSRQPAPPSKSPTRPANGRSDGSGRHSAAPADCCDHGPRRPVADEEAAGGEEDDCASTATASGRGPPNSRALHTSARIFTCDWPCWNGRTSSRRRLGSSHAACWPISNIGLPTARRPRPRKADSLHRVLSRRHHPDESSYHGGRRVFPVVAATRGVVFLATPFRGTSFQDVAGWAQPGLGILAIGGFDRLIYMTFHLANRQTLVATGRHLCTEERPIGFSSDEEGGRGFGFDT